MAKSWDISDDSELRTAVRDETDYDSDTIEKTQLDGLIDSAKRILALKAGVTDFYQDRGLAVALLGTTAAKAKASVENSPVQMKNVGPHDVTFRTPDGSSLQIAQYEDMTQTGLAQSSATSAGTKGLRLTNTWQNDTRSA